MVRAAGERLGGKGRGRPSRLHTAAVPRGGRRALPRALLIVPRVFAALVHNVLMMCPQCAACAAPPLCCAAQVKSPSGDEVVLMVTGVARVTRAGSRHGGWVLEGL